MKFRLVGENDVLVAITNLNSMSEVKQKYIDKAGKNAQVA